LSTLQTINYLRKAAEEAEGGHGVVRGTSKKKKKARKILIRRPTGDTKSMAGRMVKKIDCWAWRAALLPLGGETNDGRRKGGMNFEEERS